MLPMESLSNPIQPWKGYLRKESIEWVVKDVFLFLSGQ